MRRIGADEGPQFRAVRLAALEDAPYAFGSTLGRELRLTDADWIDRAARSADGADRALFFAHRGDDVVGLAGGYRESPGALEVELVSMWTAPAARGQGLGRALVGAVLGWAAETGATAVHLWVTAGNEPAIALYMGLGFRDTGERQPLPSDPTAQEVGMARAL